MLILIFFGLGLAAGVAFAVVAGVLYVAGAQMQSVPGLVLLVIPLWLAGLYLATRLSVIAPLAFDSGRIDFAAAWRLTQGRFWPLFAGYLLNFLITIGVSMVIGAISGIGLAIAGGALSLAFGNSSSFLVVGVAGAVFQGGLFGFLLPLYVGHICEAYRQLRDADLMSPAV